MKPAVGFIPQFKELPRPADTGGMAKMLTAALIALTVAAAAASLAAGGHSRGQTEAQAEVHVLSIVARSWPAARIPDLVDANTRLPRSNTQAICRGRGRGVSGRYTQFACVIRPMHHRVRQGLYVSYRALPSGVALVHWLGRVGP